MHLHAEEAGSGPAVLCLHGIGSSSRAFRHQLEVLGRTRRVLAWDAPGYARSADPPEPPGMDGYADAAAGLLAERGIEHAHIVGVSLGGVIAVRLALRHPGVVRSLVLADSTPGSGTDPGKGQAMRRRAEQLAAAGPEALAAERAPRLLSDAAPEELVDDVRTTMATSIRLPGYRFAAEAMAATDHRDSLSAVRAPTLVLCGSEDRVTPPALSEAIAAAVPDARLELVEGAGHLSNQERPEHFNRLVEDFFDEVDSRTATAGAAAAVLRSREEKA